MNSGDMVVCGVTGDVLIEDIRVSVPKGHAVTVPADLVVRSVDLHRQLSAGAIFQLNTNSLLKLRPPPAQEVRRVEAPEVRNLQGENEALKAENARLQTENAKLQTEVQRLLRENVELRSSSGRLDGRLDEIMTLLQQRPATVTNIIQAPQNGAKSAPDTVEDGAAPTFIPSQIRLITWTLPESRSREVFWGWR